MDNSVDVSMDEGEDTEIQQPSSSSSNKRSPRTGGANRSSVVWDYFEYSKSLDKDKCLVKSKAGVTCGAQFKGKYPKTLLDHLKSKHPNLKVKEKQEEQQKEKEKRKGEKTSSAGKQLTLEETAQRNMQKMEKYGKSKNMGNPKQQTIDHKLAILITCSNIPKSIVDCDEFRDLLFELDPKYALPGRHTVTEKIASIDKNTREKIKKLISDTDRISAICADIWSRWGITASYLGITAHFFDFKDHKIRRVLLGLERINSPHTGTRILETTERILAKWDLTLHSDKIFHILTDNGSNVIKAFWDCVQEMTYPVLQHEAVMDDNLETEADTESEDDFESREEDLSFLVTRQQWLSCVDHELACVLRAVTEGKNGNPAAKQIVVVVQELIAALRIRGKVNEFLIGNYGKKLLTAPKTRWAYQLYVFARLLELKDGIRRIFDEEIITDLENLMAAQWRVKKGFHDILEPFWDSIKDLEGEYYTTLSHVIPLISEIKITLSEIAPTCILAVLPQQFIQEIDTRFQHIFQPRSLKFQPIYLLATFLKPKFSRILNLPEFYELKRAAISEAISHRTRFAQGCESSAFTAPFVGVQTSDNTNSKFKKLFARIDQMAAAVPENTSQASIFQKELSAFQASIADNHGKEALEFWKLNENTMSHLFRLAMLVLSVPATTAPVERVFSQGGLCLGEKGNRLDDRNLEIEVMIRVNPSYM